MKSEAAALANGSVRFWSRIGDFGELTKPRIAFLVLFTVLAGGVVAGATSADAWLLTHAVVGTALVACGGAVLNQFAERDTDARMRRTASRPIPSGRVAAAEAAVVGYGAAGAGVVYLALFVPLVAVGIAIASFVLYVYVYTPLKRATSLNTVVGAVPGALPPLIGWSAVRGTLEWDSIWLFLLLFLWQFPHFFAIAWLYRDDYRKAGLCMLPTTEWGRAATAPQIVLLCGLLIPVSLAPAAIGMAGRVAWIGAILLGVQFLAFAVAFLVRQSPRRAKLVLYSSLVYLPAMLGLWMYDAVVAAA